MCKERLSLHIALLFVLAQCAPFVAFAQTTLVFSGNDNLNNWVPLHHVTITNLTRNWSDTIYYPDTTYTMYGVGIQEQTATSSPLVVLQNIPNPFNGTTSVTTSLSSASTVLMEVMDLSGHIIVSTREKLSSGAHVFRIDLQKPQTYLLKVSAGQEKAVIKMMNVGGAGSDKIQYRGEGVPTNINPKSSKDCTDYPFESGDRMMFVGYMMDGSLCISSDTIEQIQQGNEDIRLSFRLWDASWEPRHYIDTSALLIPDGVECNNNCFAVKTILINDYPGEIVTNANDVRYVRLNMEHSHIGDLYIRLTCPNGLTATLMKKYGQQDTIGCAYGFIFPEDFGWQVASATDDAYFGWHNGNDVPGNCDPVLNPQGNGWNYCWSCDTSSGYQYACGSGLVYDMCSRVQSDNPFFGNSYNYVDSTNMAAMTNVYRPEMSFNSFIGCPLNGIWSINVMDADSTNNGYLYDFELVLKEDSVYHYNPTYCATSSASTTEITPDNTRQESRLLQRQRERRGRYACYKTKYPLKRFH